MAFDRNNSVHLVTLRDEVANDPINMGYNTTSTQQLLNQLNEGENNVGGETTGETLTPYLLLQAFSQEPDDLTLGGQFTQGELDFIRMVLESTSNIYDDIEIYRTAITTAFPANATVRQALEAQSRLLSRAEVLFGVDTSITRNDWFAARDYIG